MQVAGLDAWWDAETKSRRNALDGGYMIRPSGLMIGALSEHVPPPQYFNWSRVQLDVYKLMGIKGL